MYLYVDASILCHNSANSIDRARLSSIAVALEVVTQIANYIRFYKSDRVYFFLDSQQGSWRKEVDPNYKAHRAELIKDDPEQQEINKVADAAKHVELPALIDLLVCPRFQMPYIEADDWAAACIANNEGKPGLIVTSDKDYWQLIAPNRPMLNPAHQYRIEVGLDGFLVKVKSDGTSEALEMTPPQTVLWKAMMGDKSDNLPGLCGVGETTALNVIKEGRIEQFLGECTGMVTPRKHKVYNPNPVPFYQDAWKIMNHNVAMMSLTQSAVIDKVKILAADLEKKGHRSPTNNFTRLNLHLEARGYANPEIAKILVSAYTDQWTV